MRESKCSDCKSSLQPIKLIDATEPSWSGHGARHVELGYAAPEATHSFFLGAIPRLGVVKGLICPKCGRISLYGEPT
jgi:hypothetical protein